MDGFFARPRELMGLEAFLYSLYDQPELVRRLIADRLAFCRVVYERAILDTRPDFVFLWEDMCYRGGPLLSPDMFREFLLPTYRELIGYLREMGVQNRIVDSDGDVRAGMDVVRIGKQYPRLQILGGLDTTVIAAGRPSTAST